MSSPLGSDLQQQLDSNPAGPERVSRLVDRVLGEAVKRSASDVHFEPTHRDVEIRFRLDGVLHTMARLNRDLAANLVARLKVLAELLTYRLDIPQEGRLREAAGAYGVDMRVSTFPTVHGEKVAVRIFDAAARALDLEQLGFARPTLESLLALLRERSGAVFLTGPSGSGKTTTIYACLKHLVRAEAGRRHIVTIEDPVEQVIEGVTQSQARPGTEFDFARGLRSLLRQDPEVIMIGEVRDPETAGIAIEAALTGHLVFSTLHSGSACGVIGRLMDMGIEPYLVTSAIKGILNQRLLRRACDCRQAAVEHCPRCFGTGYHGRLLVAELLQITDPMRQAILKKSDTAGLEAAALEGNMGPPVTIRSAAASAVTAGLTTQEEVDRVLGPHRRSP